MLSKCKRCHDLMEPDFKYSLFYCQTCRPLMKYDLDGLIDTLDPIYTHMYENLESGKRLLAYTDNKRNRIVFEDESMRTKPQVNKMFKMVLRLKSPVRKVNKDKKKINVEHLPVNSPLRKRLENENN